MSARANYSGLVVAGIGFFLTRFTVRLAIYENPIRFYFAGIIPLVLGLGLAAFGIALTVSDFEASLVRTTAIWCVVGRGTILVLVFLTLLGSTTEDFPNLATVQSQAYLSNFLIGGSVGGTLTGLYAAANRRHRTNVQQQANRLQVLNRLLRKKILNAVTVIQAYNSNEGAEDTRAPEIIEEQSEGIERTIEEVRHLARSTKPDAGSSSIIDLRSCLESSVATANERNPEAGISIDTCPRDLPVRATPRLEQVFTHLLDDAIIHANDIAPEIEVTISGDNARISVIDEGEGLSERQRLLLETGEIQKFDDPGTGFGLHLVRLYVEDFGGSIEADVGQSGSRITVVLPRVEIDGATVRPLPTGVNSMRPAIPHLLVTLGAALIAGVFTGSRRSGSEARSQASAPSTVPRARLSGG